jgi:pilus assembly protein Flp/PilA
VQEESGQGLSEYALILLLVAIVAIAALTLLGTDIVSVLSSVANTI